MPIVEGNTKKMETKQISCNILCCVLEIEPAGMKSLVLSVHNLHLLNRGFWIIFENIDNLSTKGPEQCFIEHLEQKKTIVCFHQPNQKIWKLFFEHADKLLG